MDLKKHKHTSDTRQREKNWRSQWKNNLEVRNIWTLVFSLSLRLTLPYVNVFRGEGKLLCKATFVE